MIKLASNYHVVIRSVTVFFFLYFSRSHRIEQESQSIAFWLRIYLIGFSIQFHLLVTFDEIILSSGSFALPFISELSLLNVRITKKTTIESTRNRLANVWDTKRNENSIDLIIDNWPIVRLFFQSNRVRINSRSNGCQVDEVTSSSNSNNWTKLSESFLAFDGETEKNSGKNYRLCQRKRIHRSIGWYPKWTILTGQLRRVQRFWIDIF